MEHIYHDQAPQQTMTVRDLMDRLGKLDPASPVIFQAPRYGVFGSGQRYPVASVDAMTIERRERHNPAQMVVDDETGDEYQDEEYMQVWRAWTGVVITCPDNS